MTCGVEEVEAVGCVVDGEFFHLLLVLMLVRVKVGTAAFSGCVSGWALVWGFFLGREKV